MKQIYIFLVLLFVCSVAWGQGGRLHTLSPIDTVNTIATKSGVDLLEKNQLFRFKDTTLVNDSIGTGYFEEILNKSTFVKGINVFSSFTDTITFSRPFNLPNTNDYTGREGLVLSFSVDNSSTYLPYILPFSTTQLWVNGSYADKYYISDKEQVDFTLTQRSDSLLWVMSNTTFDRYKVDRASDFLGKRFFDNDLIEVRSSGARYKAYDQALAYNSGVADNVLVFQVGSKAPFGENLITYSEQIDQQPPWTRLGSPDHLSILADDAIAPNGSKTAERLTVDNTAGEIRIASGIISNTGEDVTISFWAKRGNDPINDNLNIQIRMDKTGGGDPESPVFTLTSEWVRYSTTLTTPDSFNGIVFKLIGDVGDYLHLWGAQAERGIFISPYKKTVDSQVLESALYAYLSPSAGVLEADYIEGLSDIQTIRNALNYCSEIRDLEGCRDVLAVKNRVLTDTLLVPEHIHLKGAYSGYTLKGSGDWANSGTIFYLNLDDSTKTVITFAGNPQITGSEVSNLLFVPQSRFYRLARTGNSLGSGFRNITIGDFEDNGDLYNVGLEFDAGSLRAYADNVVISDFIDYGIVNNGNQINLSTVRTLNGPTGIYSRGGGLICDDCWGEALDTSWIDFQGSNLWVKTPTLESVPFGAGSSTPTIKIGEALSAIFMNGDIDGADPLQLDNQYLFDVDNVANLTVMGVRFIRGRPIKTTENTGSVDWMHTTGPYPGEDGDWTGVYDSTKITVHHVSGFGGSGTELFNWHPNIRTTKSRIGESKIANTTQEGMLDIRTDTINLTGPQNLFPNSDDFTTDWSNSIAPGATELVAEPDSLNPLVVAENVFSLNWISGTHGSINTSTVTVDTSEFYNLSIWVKQKNGADGWILPVMNIIGNPDAYGDTLFVSSEWVRYDTKVFSPGASLTSVEFQTSQDSFLVYGPQISKNEFVGEYQETTGAAILESTVDFDGQPSFSKYGKGDMTSINLSKTESRPVSMAPDGTLLDGSIYKDLIPLTYNSVDAITVDTLLGSYLSITSEIAGFDVIEATYTTVANTNANTTARLLYYDVSADTYTALGSATIISGTNQIQATGLTQTLTTGDIIFVEVTAAGSEANGLSVNIRMQ